jgi:ATP-dependent Clp protease ATP-binding subunit ClpA
MFERFTTQAREAVFRAQEEARDLEHPYIGTEHILLALLSPDAGIAHAVLHDAGLNRTRARADIKSVLHKGSQVLGEGDAEALQEIGIDLDAVRARIEEAFGPGALATATLSPKRRRGLLDRLRRRPAPPPRPQGKHRPFTIRAKKVLELSLREAVRLRHNHIGTEHILLGLLREGNGLAAKVLADAGLDFEVLRRQTVAAIRKAA